MNKGWIALIVLIGIMVGACQAEPTPTTTPATLPTIGRPPFSAAPVAALSLLRNPADFKNLDIELSGQFKPLPILVCGEETHASPATWSIVDGEVEILASGFDTPLRELANPGLDLVVKGRWQQWEGPVGCGRRVPAEKLWYLAVESIISPNPLVGGEQEGIAHLPPTEAPGDNGDQPLPSPIGETQTPPGDPAGLPETVTVTPSDTPNPFDQATSTPPGTLTAIPTITAQVTATVAATPTGVTTATVSASSTPASQTTTTPTPSMTPAAGATSLATATTANTATATTVAGEYTPVGYEDLTKRSISANDAHTYRFVATNGDIVNITAAPQSGLDVSIELVGPAGDTLQVRGLGGAGQVESMGPYSINEGGVHQIIIRAGNSPGDYALVVQETDALPYIVFKGNMAYGDTVGGSVPIDRDDLWNFMGSAGDNITIRSAATSDTDLILYLNGPDSIEIDFSDEDLTIGPPDDEEEIVSIQLDEDGMYTIGIGEIDFSPIAYTLSLIRN